MSFTCPVCGADEAVAGHKAIVAELMARYVVPAGDGR